MLYVPIDHSVATAQHLHLIHLILPHRRPLSLVNHLHHSSLLRVHNLSLIYRFNFGWDRDRGYKRIPLRRASVGCCDFRFSLRGCWSWNLTVVVGTYFRLPIVACSMWVLSAVAWVRGCGVRRNWISDSLSGLLNCPPCGWRSTLSLEFSVKRSSFLPNPSFAAQVQQLYRRHPRLISSSACFDFHASEEKAVAQMTSRQVGIER